MVSYIFRLVAPFLTNLGSKEGLEGMSLGLVYQTLAQGHRDLMCVISIILRSAAVNIE